MTLKERLKEDVLTRVECVIGLYEARTHKYEHNASLDSTVLQDLKDLKQQILLEFEKEEK